MLSNGVLYMFNKSGADAVGETHHGIEQWKYDSKETCSNVFPHYCEW